MKTVHEVCISHGEKTACRLLAVLMTLLVSSGIPVGAGETDPDPLAAEVHELVSAWNHAASPGLAVAVLREGDVLLREGFGSANLEYGIPISTNTVFQAASLSKQFTAFSIALLGAQGMLSLDDELRDHLPSVPDFGEPITIRQTIHHMSGLRDQWELLLFAGWRSEDVVTQDHVLGLVERQKALNFAPGSEYRYTNTGYTLLPEIVRQVTGQSFAQWTAINIFRPLGMKSSQFRDDHLAVIPNRAYSYFEKEDGTYGKAMAPGSTVGATNLFTTVEDLVTWCLNFEQGVVGSESLLAQVQTPGRLNDGSEIRYAFGLLVGSYRGLRTIAHGGGQAGFRAYLLRIPEKRFAVVVMANLQSIPAGRIAYRIADIYLRGEWDEPQTASNETDEDTIDPGAWSDFVGTYLLSPGYAVTVTRRGDTLAVRTTGQDEAPMRAEATNRFFVEAYGSHVVFSRGEESEAITIEVAGASGGQVAAWTPSPADLEEYTGRFFSEELRTTYDLLVRDGCLVLRHPRRGDEILHPTVTDQFGEDMADDFGIDHPWFRSLDYVRGEDGAITGFHVTVGGAENVWFEKRICG